MTQTDPKQTPVILPFAGGKGGVGKSIVAANTAIALAQQGFQVTTIDLDLGGSNLHTCLGMSNRFPGIGDFVRSGKEDLNSFLTDTGIENLTFVPGDGSSSFMANITYHQKQQIVKAIPQLSAHYVVLDLGAGSSYNVLDFFSLTGQGVVVTTPEFPAIFSVLALLKNLLFRNMELNVKKNRHIGQLLSSLFNRPTFHPSNGEAAVNQPMNEPLTSETIINAVAKEDSESAAELRRICKWLRPTILFNMGSHPDEMSVIKQFKRGLNRVLSMEANYLGFILSDENVKESVKKRKPLLTLFPDCPASQEIKQISRRLVKYGNRELPDSDVLLMESTRKFYNTIHP